MLPRSGCLKILCNYEYDFLSKVNCCCGNRCQSVSQFFQGGYRHGYHRQSQTVCKDHQRLLCTGQRWKQQCVTLYCYYYLTETVRPTFVRPEVRHDSDAAVIPGGLTPLIQTLFGKILPHPNFAVAITNSLTQYCNRSRGYQCRIYGGGISLWSWGSVGILQ